METSITKRKTKLAMAVLNLFLENPRRSTGEISKVGGRSHTRRLSDLRKVGHVIEIVADQGEDKIYEYRGHSLQGPHDLDIVKKMAKRILARYEKPGGHDPGFEITGPLGHDTCPTCHGTGSVPRA